MDDIVAPAKCLSSPVIDAGVFAYPFSNTSANRMALTAKTYGLSGIVIREPGEHNPQHSSLAAIKAHTQRIQNQTIKQIDTEQNNSSAHTFFLIHGRVFSGLNQQNLRNAIKKTPLSASLSSVPIIHFVDAGDVTYNRGVLSTLDGMVLSRIHAAPRQAFDHICAKSAVDRHILVDLDLSALISKGSARQKALRQYENVITLADKYEFGLTISSGAKGYLGICTPREIALMCELVGMTSEMTTRALAAPFELLYPRKSVREVINP
jgi:RNase P/RNase MRP subunit p30